MRAKAIPAYRIGERRGSEPAIDIGGSRAVFATQRHHRCSSSPLSLSLRLLVAAAVVVACSTSPSLALLFSYNGACEAIGCRAGDRDGGDRELGWWPPCGERVSDDWELALSLVRVCRCW